MKISAPTGSILGGTQQAELHKFFFSSNDSNPLRKSFSYSSVRLNIAGGEPLLYPKEVLNILAAARERGFETSIITNGSRLKPEMINGLASLISVFGLSIDSINEHVNRAIGRTDKRFGTLSTPDFSQIIGIARQANPTLHVKINTVVNSLNFLENMAEAIAGFAPDNWKIFIMLPSVNDELSIPSHIFESYVKRNEVSGILQSVEDNADMTDSYIMIDPFGRFYQTSPGQSGHTYSRPIVAVGAELAFSDIGFSIDKFCSRYNVPTGY